VAQVNSELEPLNAYRMSGCTRVGNWREDGIAEAETIDRLLAQRAAGTLRADVHARRLAAATASVTLPPLGDDGYLHFGQPTALVNGEGTAALVLASSVYDMVLTPDKRACAAMLAPAVPPCVADSTGGATVSARCGFVLERCA
jgi:hypothetical protein